eukprot:1526959-Pyramimonas_sp.AAC.1
MAIAAHPHPDVPYAAPAFPFPPVSPRQRPPLLEKQKQRPSPGAHTLDPPPHHRTVPGWHIGCSAQLLHALRTAQRR